jgi:heme A synthase
MARPAHPARNAPLRDERATVLRLLRKLATVGAALMLVVVVASAYLRLAQAGLSCVDWPACYGRIATHSEPGPDLRVARLAHRLAASAVGVALIALLLVAATQRPRPKVQTAIAAGALLVALGLAGVGARFSAADIVAPLPLVTLLNLGGGFALLALLWWLRVSSQPAPSPPVKRRVGLQWFVTLALVALIAQIVLGALVSAKFAALSCPSFPVCGAPWPEGALSSLDPTQPLVRGADGAIIRLPALAALPWMHRIGALAVGALGALLVVRILRAGGAGRRLAVVLAALLVAQAALGATATLQDLPLPIVLAHNLVAALLLCNLVSLSWLAHANAASP